MRLIVPVVLLMGLARMVRAQGADAGRIEGTITETIGSRSARAATLSLVRLDSEPSVSFDARPDTAGHYRLDTLPAGRYLANLTSATLDSLELALPSREVVIAAGQTTRADFSLPSGPTLRDAVCPGPSLGRGKAVVAGRAMDVDTEQALAGADVVVSWTEIAVDAATLKSQSTERSASVRTGPRGEYRLCGVPTGSWLSIQLQHAGRAGTAIRVAVSDDEGAVVRDLSLSAGGAPTIAALDSVERIALSAGVDSTTGELRQVGTATLTGTVRGAAGQPLADAHVHVRDARANATTSADGRFTLGALPEGTQILVVRRLGYALAELPVELRVGRTVRLDVQLSRAVALDSVLVSAYRTRYREFEFNRGADFAGKFLTSDQIVRRKVKETGDLLARLGGFTVVGHGSIARVYSKKELLRRTPCPVNVVVDGVQHSSINDVPPSLVEGLEAYTGPPSISSPYRDLECGVIVIWTKAWRRPTRAATVPANSSARTTQ
ncbi:MAG: TonB-dependent receptor [Gemmatimonadaceae bacterium]